MQKLVKKVCVVAAIVFAAVDVFAAQELETLNGMPDASNNVWRYYAAGEEGSPAAGVACVAQGDWVFGATFDALSGALGLSSYVAGEGVLNLLNAKVQDAAGMKTEVKSLTFPAECQKIPMTELWATDATGLPYMGVVKDLDASLATTNNANYYVKRIYIKSDLVTEVKDYNFSFCYGLTNIILRCPNLVKWGKRVLFYTSVTNDIKEIVSPAVQSMGLYALCWWTPDSPKGYRVSLVTGSLVVTNQLGNIAQESWGNVTNVYLRGDNYLGSQGNGIDTETLLDYSNDRLETITLWWPKVRQFGVKNRFISTNTKTLKEFRLYMPALTNIVADSLVDKCLSQSGGSVYALGPVYKVDSYQLSYLMGRLVEGYQWNNNFKTYTDAGNASKAGTRYKFYCSKRWGWKDALEKITEPLASPAGKKEEGYFAKLTEGTDEAKNAPEGCFGMWVSNGRRTYLIDYPQEGEGFGMVIRIQ